MKLVYKNDTKRVSDALSYEQLVMTAHEIFNLSMMVQLGENLKFFYQDSDGDIISVTNQSDLNEATQQMIKPLKLIIAQNADEMR